MTCEVIRIRTFTMIVGLLAVVALTVVSFPAAAQARCVGQNSETTSRLKVAGTTYATEDPLSGTCNGNTLFRTYIQSNLPGWRVSLHLKSGSTWYIYYGSGYDTNLNYVEFNDSNSHSLIHLCVDNGLGLYLCGWGDRLSNTITAVAHDVYDYNDGY
jgi:hypothetical protein